MATRSAQSHAGLRHVPVSVHHEYFKIETSSNKTSELNVWMRTGKYHIELDFYNTQIGYDSYILSHIIKNLKYVKLNNDCEFHQFYVMLFHFEKSVVGNQYMLRRILEKIKYVTFVITTRNVSRVLDSVRSRFYCVRIPKTFDVMPSRNWKESIQMFAHDESTKDIVVRYRKCAYDAMLLGIEPTHILKHIWDIFRIRGCSTNTS